MDNERHNTSKWIFALVVFNLAATPGAMASPLSDARLANSSINSPAANSIGQRSAAPPLNLNSTQNPKQLLQLGAFYFAHGDKLRAAVAFRKVLVFDHANADALYNLGAIAESDGDLRSAQRYYSSAMNMRPGDDQISQAFASVTKQLNDAASSPYQLTANHRLLQVDPVINGGQFNTTSGTFPVVGVTQPNSQIATVPAQRKKTFIEKMRWLPEPLHCPVCAIPMMLSPNYMIGLKQFPKRFAPAVPRQQTAPQPQSIQPVQETQPAPAP